ncbi:MAG: hypothetical protein JW749_12555, partial [Sedimentisphaerales bacterium]|nr:hypothetical protein [Sedimentisphaerales bacterium]
GRVVGSPEDIDELADALAYFNKTTNIQKASQAIMQDNIRQEVSITRVAGRLKDVYDAIIDKRPPLARRIK